LETIVSIESAPAHIFSDIFSQTIVQTISRYNCNILQMLSIYNFLLFKLRSTTEQMLALVVVLIAKII
jgi:hypothetical protein